MENMGRPLPPINSALSNLTTEVMLIKAMVIVELAISLHVPPTKPPESGPSQT